MKEINLREMNWLISEGYIKCRAGKYNNLTVTGRKSKKKKRYTIDSIYEKLKELYEKKR